MKARQGSITLAVTVLGISIASSFGCAGAPKPGLGYGVGRAWNKTVGGEVHQTKVTPVEMTGLMDVEVDNFAGDVVIHTTGRADTGGLEVVRRAMHGMGHRSESEDSLKEIFVTWEIQERGDREVLLIHSTTSHVFPWFQAADIDVTVPQLGVVVVRTGRGHVAVTEFQDGVDIETTQGDVRVATSTPITLPSTILNKDGSIDWRVPPRSAGDYQMETINGEVQVRVREGKWLATDRRNDVDSNYGVLNKGTNFVILRTVGGDIQIYVGKNPTEMGTFID